MKLLLKSVTIFDNSSPHHRETLDIYIENGIIKKIGNDLEVKADQTINQTNLHVSPGWFDSSVNFGEPGYEERETIANGLKVAGKSGFTSVAVNPYTNPVLDHSSSISALKSKANSQPVNLHPIGALSMGSNGVDLAELLDMKEAGAIGFGDYKLPVTNPELLKIALLYAQNFDALVQSFPMDKKLAGKGIVNEHETSTSLGLKGIPNLAEDLQVARDLFILEYTGGKLHIPTISTGRSVELIKEAKKKGLDVSCSVAIHNLLLTDKELEDFNTSAKLLPPLRTENDRKALIQGLKDGVIDMVTSDHNPIDIENKKVEFDNALFGSIGLESAFGALCTIFEPEEAVQYLSAGKSRFGLPSHSIKEGEPVELSMFIPGDNYTFTKAQILSASANSVFLGKDLKGRAYGIVTSKGILTH